MASHRVRDGSLHLASGEDILAYSGRKTEVSGIALNRAKAQAHLSSEAKFKALCSANLAQPRSEANLASLKAPVQCYIASFTSSSGAKELFANLALPCEAKSHNKVILTSLETNKKHRVFQPKRAIIQSPRASVLDRLGPVKIGLREYPSNKQKLCSEKLVHISPSQRRQAGCQLVTVHSVQCYLGSIPTTSSPSQQSVFNQLSVQTSKRSKS